MTRKNDIEERKKERVKKMLETKQRNKEIKLKDTQQLIVECPKDTIQQNNETISFMHMFRRFNNIGYY